MSTSLRQRKPVDYTGTSNIGSATPGWLKLSAKKVECEDAEHVTGKAVKEQIPERIQDKKGNIAASNQPGCAAGDINAAKGRSKSAPLRELPQNEKVDVHQHRKSTGGIRAQEEASSLDPDCEETSKKRKRAKGRDAKTGTERTERAESNEEKRVKNAHDKSAPLIEKNILKGTADPETQANDKVKDSKKDRRHQNVRSLSAAQAGTTNPVSSNVCDGKIVQTTNPAVNNADLAPKQVQASQVALNKRSCDVQRTSSAATFAGACPAVEGPALPKGRSQPTFQSEEAHLPPIPAVIHTDKHMASIKETMILATNGRANISEAPHSGACSQENKSQKKASGKLQAAVTSVPDQKVLSKPQAASVTAGPVSLLHDTHEAPAPSASTFNFQAFKLLQEQYAELQILYQQLKEQKIQDLEGLLEEQDEYVDELRDSVQKLADHWKEQAEKQVELSRKAGSADFVARSEHLQEENTSLRLSLASMEEEVVRLRKEVTERDARAAASAAHMLAVHSQLNAELEAARAVADAAKEEIILLKASMVHQAQTPGVNSFLMQHATPTAHSGLHNISMQYPTPPLPPIPSPGIGTQFPSPADVAQNAPMLSGSMMVPLVHHAPVGTLGLGLPPASAAFRGRRSPHTMISNSVNHPPGLAIAPKPNILDVSLAEHASEVHVGSPVEGLCEEAVEPRQSEHRLALALVPEGCTLPAPPPAAGLTTQEIPAPTFPDLPQDPESALKAHASLHQWAQHAAATVADWEPATSSELRSGHMLPGDLGPLMSAVKSTAPEVTVHENNSQAEVEAGQEAEGLSAGMMQLMMSAQATAGSLGNQAASRGSTRGAPAAAAASATAVEEGLQDSAQELSNQLSTNMGRPGSLVVGGLSPKLASDMMNQRSNSKASTPGLTPRTKSLVGAVVNFFGFKVLPIKQEGSYEYVHPQSGLRFELGPIQVDDSELAAAEGEGDEEVGEGATSVTVLHYRPINIGKARLPKYLQEEIMVPLFSKQAFVNQLWSAVNGLI
ncbi:hypothetical protein CEUSTIGMA_g1292.t1 [Chlamydomonas eustigma]|uniref:Uncharacterized protein n=1 Tax=Chlamydomonas eustigma TaxID=1157962 RepID=A0A250WT61_9CHLO|nr:hypothetical protein CEUSTIGMA_g1292.t1 [Chlamydomonas eustigma]|eukprot:GAX73842.1 hypothetical protein CEUSTIGMA_g1292.t1 [Chlamydomonas eustigma]